MTSPFERPSPGLVPPPDNLAVPDADGVVSADVVVIGSGMGGSTIAHALRDSGLDVLVVERGGFLPREIENWSSEAVFEHARYKNSEQWYSAEGPAFQPGVYYYVGGNTKFYGAMMPRFRERDFAHVEHREGVSPAWPITYADLEPFYCEAEALYGVRGTPGQEPTEPTRSKAYPHPAVPHEPAIQRLADDLAKQGLRPIAMPLAIARGHGGGCVQCRTCDGFPCMVDAKGEADVSVLRPLVRSGRVRLLTGTVVTRLETSGDGRAVTHAVGQRSGHPVTIRAARFVVAAGAVNSAALFLRSTSEAHPGGLGNGSGQVGQNYMVHNSTFFVAIDPRRTNHTYFQKTLGLNDWYFGTTDWPWPMGNVQMLGKLQAPMIAASRPWAPKALLRYMTRHSVDLYLTSEDLPVSTNRVTVGTDGRIVVHWTPNNLMSHSQLVRHTTSAMRRAGFPLVFTERMGIETNSHMCGTLRMGSDPATSVVDPTCRMHELRNVWVTDSSSFVSSAAVNPALTIAANALRVATTSDLLGPP